MSAPSRLDSHFSSLIGRFLNHLRGVWHSRDGVARSMGKLKQGKGHVKFMRDRFRLQLRKDYLRCQGSGAILLRAYDKTGRRMYLDHHRYGLYIVQNLKTFERVEIFPLR